MTKTTHLPAVKNPEDTAMTRTAHKPVDKTEPAYNGRILVRLPKSLHRQLAEEAKDEGVSLNQYMLYKLSR